MNMNALRQFASKLLSHPNLVFFEFFSYFL